MEGRGREMEESVLVGAMYDDGHPSGYIMPRSLTPIELLVIPRVVSNYTQQYSPSQFAQVRPSSRFMGASRRQLMLITVEYTH